MQGTKHSESAERQNDEKSLICYLNPCLVPRKAENPQLRPADGIYQRNSTLFIQTFEANSRGYEIELTVSFNIQYGRDRTEIHLQFW
jgi:hypothetical protein